MEIDQLATLIAIAPPPFVFVHDAICVRDTIGTLQSALISEEKHHMFGARSPTESRVSLLGCCTTTLSMHWLTGL